MTVDKGGKEAGSQIETVTSVLIAVVAVLTPVVVWRASRSSGQETDADRLGMINTLKAAAAKSENLAYLYQQEADLAQRHVLLAAQIDYLRARAAAFAASADGAREGAILSSEADALLLADQGTVVGLALVADAVVLRPESFGGMAFHRNRGITLESVRSGQTVASLPVRSWEIWAPEMCATWHSPSCGSGDGTGEHCAIQTPGRRAAAPVALLRCTVAAPAALLATTGGMRPGLFRTRSARACLPATPSAHITRW